MQGERLPGHFGFHLAGFGLRFVLPRRLGEVALIDDVAEDDVRKVLERTSENLTS